MYWTRLILGLSLLLSCLLAGCSTSTTGRDWATDFVIAQEVEVKASKLPGKQPVDLWLPTGSVVTVRAHQAKSAGMLSCR